MGKPSKKKFCHCKPTCGKRLAKSTRRRHYKRENLEEQQSSESESPSDFEMSGPTPSSSHIPESLSSASSASDESHRMDLDEMSLNDDPQSDILLSDDSMDAESECESDSVQNSDDSGGILEDEDEWICFDEDLEHDIPKSLEEMQKELDEMLFADEEEDLWEIRMFIIFQAGTPHSIQIQGTIF
jgi:hypothetical protein